MRPATCASAAVAVLLHALLLFGVDSTEPATPLPPAPAPIVVGLVESAPSPPPEPAVVPSPPPASPPPRELPVPTPKRVAKRVVPVPKPTTSAPDAPPSSAGTPTSASTREEVAAVSPAGAVAGSGSERAAPSQLPRYRSTPEPAYPAAARREREQGVVLLAVDVGTDGRPTAVAVKRSSGFPRLDAAAVGGVRRWRFDPARTAGVPVASRVEIPIRFSLSD